MHVFSLEREQQWDPKRHVENILGKIADGDVTVACWEPGQISPYHCHPHATEIYFLLLGWRHHEDAKRNCPRHAWRFRGPSSPRSARI